MHKYLSLVILVFLNTDVFSQNLQWAKSVDGSSNLGWSIAVDHVGNVYTTGRFQGSVDLDPGSGVVNYESAGAEDVFISKLDVFGNFVWAKSIGGAGNDVGFSIAVDADENVYVSGDFGFTVDFDPGQATYNLTSPTFNSYFILKLNSDGDFAWAKNLMSTSADYINSEGWHLAVDGMGNVYTSGSFNGSGDFNPGPDTFRLTSAGFNDIFVLKLDASGTFVWAKNMGGTKHDEGRAIAVDESGNVYTTGVFSDIADFDPGPEKFRVKSLGGRDVFISKLDVSGNFVWAKFFRGSFTEEGGYSIAVDASGDVYTTGFFGNTVDFDPGEGTYNMKSAGNSDIFISKLDALGSFVWAKSFGGNSRSLGDQGFSIALDADDNVYTTGHFFKTADFDPGTEIFNLTAAGDADNADIFISKLDASGNFVWAKSFGAELFDFGSGLAVDKSKNIYITGFFQGAVDFDAGPGIINLTSTDLNNSFIVKLGTTYTTTKDGNWDDPNTWAGKAVPTGGLDVVIRSKVFGNINTKCKSLTVQSPGSLTINTGITINISH